MSIVITFPRSGPYGQDNHVPAPQIIRWYRDDDRTKVVLKDNGTITTSMSVEQVDKLYLAAMQSMER